VPTAEQGLAEELGIVVIEKTGEQDRIIANQIAVQRSLRDDARSAAREDVALARMAGGVLLCWPPAINMQIPSLRTAARKRPKEDSH
jgi:hypothetical protein